MRYSATRAGFIHLELRLQDGELLLVIHELTDLGHAKQLLHEVLMLTVQSLLNTAIGMQSAGQPRLPYVATFLSVSAVRPLDTLSNPNPQPWSPCACQI